MECTQLRTAAVNLALQRISEKADKWPIRIDKFTFKDVTGIGSGEVGFHSPLTIITGKNSAGKTTFLRSLWVALDPIAAFKSQLTRRKIRTGSFYVSGYNNGKSYNEVVTLEDDDLVNLDINNLNIIHLDSADAIADLQQKMFRLGEVVDIINGAPERTLETPDLGEVSYLNRRDYGKVTVYEVEIEGGLVAPFFEVTYGSVKYDATQMGAGEYAALFLWWTLSNAQKGSIILIEEPETFLSVLNQESLLNFLVKIIEKNKHCAIMTSHSGNLLQAMPAGSVRYLSRSGGNCSVVDSPDPTYLEAVGMEFRKDIFVFVEDGVAKTIGEIIIERFDPLLARRCQLAVVHGEAVITKSLEGLADNPFGLKFLGWYDGDQAGKLPAKIASFAAFLPGDKAIETILRTMAHADPDALGAALGSNRVVEVLGSLEGVDHHDWLWRFAKAINRDPQSVLTGMFGLWLADSDNLKTAEERFQEFRAIAERK